MQEKRFLIGPNESEDEQCIEAWRKLSAEFWISDLMRAFYGGIALGHIEFGYEFWSPRKHHTSFVVLGQNPKPLTVDSVGTMCQRVRIPFSDIRQLLALHSFDEREMVINAYEREQVNALHVVIQIGPVDPDETGLGYEGKPFAV